MNCTIRLSTDIRAYISMRAPYLYRSELARSGYELFYLRDKSLIWLPYYIDTVRY